MPADVVGRVVGLQPDRHAPGQADGVAEAVDDPALAGHQDQVLVAHQLGDGGHHLRREAGRERARTAGVAASDSSQSRKPPTVRTGDRREGRRIVAVDDQARDLVVLIGNQASSRNCFSGSVGQRHLGGDVLLRRWRRHRLFSTKASRSLALGLRIAASRLPRRSASATTSHSPTPRERKVRQPFLVGEGDQRRIEHRLHQPPERVTRVGVVLCRGQRGLAGQAAQDQDAGVPHRPPAESCVCAQRPSDGSFHSQPVTVRRGAPA
jgi:hypothetical protein